MAGLSGFNKPIPNRQCAYRGHSYLPILGLYLMHLTGHGVLYVAVMG